MTVALPGQRPPRRRPHSLIARPHSLRTRLMLLVLGAVLLAWLGAGLLTAWRAQHELDELLDGHLAQAAALLVVQQARVELDDVDEPVDAPSLHRYAPRVAFQVWHEGRLTLRSANAPQTPMAPPGQGFAEGLRTLRMDGVDWRVFAARGAASDVRVFVGERLDSRDEILHAVLGSAGVALALALPLLMVGLAWAVQRGTAPLRALGAQLAQRRAQDLQPLQAAEVPAEVQPMVAALNALFARIAELLAAERRFTADAAHELRTPIAAVRTQAQVALGATDEAERTHALRHTLEGCDRATRLVDQLLTLARLEADGALAGAACDLAAVARRVAAELAPRALKRQQELELLADTPCPVQGNETLLAVLVRNLVDNALRYSPEGARVRVVLGTQGGRVEMSVDDSGPGLAEADLARLGERFFRAAGQAVPGSGLGWSIVRRIAAAHGFTLQVLRSPELGGLRVVLQGPAV